MTGRRWLGVVGVGLLLAGSGCVSCGYHTCKKLADAAPHCDVPGCDRRHVYVLLVNGLTPGGCLEKLRDPLAAEGFAKVYHGELCHAGWLYDEMKRVRDDDPAARFVLVGYDLACGTVAGMARDGIAAGLPIDAVLLLDPVGKADARAPAVKTILVQSGACSSTVPHTESVPAPAGNHFTLPTHPNTVATLLGVLKESAARVEHPPTVEEPLLQYDGAPPPRSLPFPGPGATEDWYFLHDQPGPHAVPLSPVLPVPFAAPQPLPTPRPVP